MFGAPVVVISTMGLEASMVQSNAFRRRMVVVIQLVLVGKTNPNVTSVMIVVMPDL